MAKKKNPFRVLGLSDEVLRLIAKKSPDMLIPVAESQYHALQRVFHPDLGGSEAASMALNEAIKNIRDAKDLAELIPVPSHAREHITELEKMQKIATEQHAILGARFMEYIMGSLGGDPLAQNREIHILHAGKGVKILVRELHTTHYSMAIGRVMRKNLTPSGRSVLTIPSLGIIARAREFIQQAYPKARKDISMRESQEKGLLAGVADEKYVSGQQLVHLLYGSSVHDASRPSIGPELPPSIGNASAARILPSSFSLILPHLSPYLKKDAWLFSLRRDQEGAYFRLEGNILELRSDE